LPPAAECSTTAKVAKIEREMLPTKVSAIEALVEMPEGTTGSSATNDY